MLKRLTAFVLTAFLLSQSLVCAGEWVFPEDTSELSEDLIMIEEEEPSSESDIDDLEDFDVSVSQEEPGSDDFADDLLLVDEESAGIEMEDAAPDAVFVSGESEEPEDQEEFLQFETEEMLLFEDDLEEVVETERLLADEGSSSVTIVWNGNKYTLFNDSMTWSEANAECESMGGHLLTINSADEQQMITNDLLSLASKYCYWIGLYRDAVGSPWKWVDEAPVDYMNWASGEPNNDQSKKETCVEIFGKNFTGDSGKRKYAGQWNDATDSGAKYAGRYYTLENTGYICEWDHYKNKIVPDYQLSADTISFKKDSLGEELNLSLSVENVLTDGSIDELSEEEKEALCFHTTSIEFKIEGTPVAYFKEIGDEEYSQEYTIVPLDDGLNVTLGEKKELASFEIPLNPPVIIDNPTQTAEISYEIKGTSDGSEYVIKDTKTVTFLYDIVKEEEDPDLTGMVDDWISNEGTLASIRYLSNSSNFISYLFATEADEGFGASLTRTMSDLFYRDFNGWLELGAGTLSVQEAEQILIDFLGDVENEVTSIAKVEETAKMAESLAEGFKEYVKVVNADVLDTQQLDVDQYLLSIIENEIYDHLIKGEYGGLSYLQGEYNELVRQNFYDYMNSLKATEAVTKGCKIIGYGAKFLKVSFETYGQIRDVNTLLEADEIYLMMLDYIASHSQYEPVKKAAGNLSGVINENIINKTALFGEAVINESVNLIGDGVVKGVLKFTKEKMADSVSGFSIYTIAAQVGYTVGVTISNTVLHTADIQTLKDRMKILSSLGITLGNWIDEGLNAYPSSSASGRLARARQVAYGEYILLKTRMLGEKTYQKLCQYVKTTSSYAYGVSVQISTTLDNMQEWMEGSGHFEIMRGVGFYCPVDVEVLDGNGNLILTIHDGAETSGKAGSIRYLCTYNPLSDDYAKILIYPRNTSYTIRCRGCSDGFVSSFVGEYGTDGVMRCVTFADEPVNSSTVITTVNPAASSETYSVVDNGESGIHWYEQTARHDGDHKVTAWTVKQEPTYFQTGLRAGKCSICNKTVTEKIPVLKGTAPKITNVYNSSKGGDIRWKTVPDAAGYKVYRQRSSEGIKVIATINDPSVTQCYDTTIRDNCWGCVYHYYVTAIYKENKNTKESPKSEKLVLQRLAPMKITYTALNGRRSIDVAWECTVKDNKALGYEVQYATSSSDLSGRTGSFKKVSIDGRKNMSTTLKSLTRGKTYFIRVRCYVTYTHSVTGQTTKTWSQYGSTVKLKVP